MNPAYDTILSADDETRSGLFTATAQRLGTTPQNVEKDFWVCWTLDALFNGIPEGPRLLFKGGTSLAMSGMIFGQAPSFEAVTESIADLERRVNAIKPG